MGRILSQFATLYRQSHKSRSLDSPETSRKIEDSRYDSADVSWAHLVWDDDMYCPRGVVN